jgi:hypothetical protein
MYRTARVTQYGYSLWEFGVFAGRLCLAIATQLRRPTRIVRVGRRIA